MSDSMKAKLKVGFTLTRWGIDLCFGGLFVALAAIIPSIVNKNLDYLGKLLIVAMVLVFAGLIVFFIGRVIVGLQARKLNFETKRPLTEEEAWFLHGMLGVEAAASETNLGNQIARHTGTPVDDVAMGAKSAKIAGSFNKYGKRYRSKSFLFNRFPLLATFVIAVIIAIIKMI